MPNIYDISTPLNANTPVFPGDPHFIRTIEDNISKGDAFNFSTITMGAHTGTHIDAPYHFFNEGRKTDEIPPERWVSPAVVIEAASGLTVDADTFQSVELQPGDSVLLKANSNYPEETRSDCFRAISTEAAHYLVSRNINLIGIDALSIETYDDESFPVHHILLHTGILILEGIRLDLVPPGRYTLFVAPLLITGGDGAPARALLLQP